MSNKRWKVEWFPVDKVRKFAKKHDFGDEMVAAALDLGPDQKSFPTECEAVTFASRVHKDCFFGVAHVQEQDLIVAIDPDGVAPIRAWEDVGEVMEVMEIKRDDDPEYDQEGADPSEYDEHGVRMDPES